MNREDHEERGLRAAPDDGLDGHSRQEVSYDRELSGQIIGCAIRVHTALGPGFSEVVYRRALELELESQHVPFVSEFSITVSYRGTPVGRHRLDVLVASEIVLELKAVPAIDRLHVAQVLAYLRATRTRVGYVLNFGSGTLGVRRVVL